MSLTYAVLQFIPTYGIKTHQLVFTSSSWPVEWNIRCYADDVNIVSIGDCHTFVEDASPDLRQKSSYVAP